MNAGHEESSCHKQSPWPIPAAVLHSYNGKTITIYDDQIMEENVADFDIFPLHGVKGSNFAFLIIMK